MWKLERLKKDYEKESKKFEVFFDEFVARTGLEVKRLVQQNKANENKAGNLIELLVSIQKKILIVAKVC